MAEGTCTAGQARSSIALVAMGGYARRELCFRSDVDLLLLTDGTVDDALGPLAERLFYPLWDCRLQVGQSVGTVDEVLAGADGDARRQHALLDLRFLAGAGALFDNLTRGVSDRLDSGWREALLARVVPENQRRWGRYGESVFRLEPHLKEGKGGLRDLHWLLWIGRALHGLRAVSYTHLTLPTNREV